MGLSFSPKRLNSRSTAEELRPSSSVKTREKTSDTFCPSFKDSTLALSGRYEYVSKDRSIVSVP